MSRIVEALKKIAVALGCAPDVNNIRANNIEDVLNYIAKNYGNEENEPYNLTATGTNATITMTCNGKSITAGVDKLYNGDVLKITATPQTGYNLTTLTLNGTTIESGDTFTVNGHNVAIVAEAETSE